MSIRHNLRGTLILIRLAMLATAWNAVVFAQPPAAPSEWPRAAILVFERRVPPALSNDPESGARLREVREEAIRQLQTGLEPGDQVFVFADGVSREDFNCLVFGTSCLQSEASYIEWGRGVSAARRFLAAMLRLPRRPAPGPQRRRGPDGQEFLQLTFGGDMREIDCAVRREITAPMTEGFDPAAPCPLEAGKIDSGQARAVSRVELTAPLQVAAALGSLGASPPREVELIWALLGEKNYNRSDTLNGIRQDFSHAPLVIDFFEKSSNEYWIDPKRPPVRLPSRQMVSVLSITSRSSGEVAARLREHPDSLTLQLGRHKQQSIPRDLQIGTGVLGGPWRPEVDEFAVSAALRDVPEARLWGGSAVFSTDGGAPERLRAARTPSGAVWFEPVATQERYRRALKAHIWEKGTSFDATFALLVSGADAGLPYNLPAIPATVAVHRSVRVMRPVDPVA